MDNLGPIVGWPIVILCGLLLIKMISQILHDRKTYRRLEEIENFDMPIRRNNDG